MLKLPNAKNNIKSPHKILPAWNAITFPRRLKCCINQNSHENAFLYALPFNSFMPGDDIRSCKLKQTTVKKWRFV